MCLTDPKPISTLQRWMNKFLPKKGWKIILLKQKNKANSVVFNHSYSFNQYHHAKGEPIPSFNVNPPTTSSYPPGFHIFLNMDDAISWHKGYTIENDDAALIQVKYKGIHTQGNEQQHLHAVVASKIKFLKNSLVHLKGT